MAAAFFGNVMVTPDSSLSSYSASSSTNTTTTLIVEKDPSDYTYLWGYTGTTINITNGTI